MIALTRQALKRPSVTLIIALAIIVFGIATIGSVKQELFPSLSLPIISITAVYPGASAEAVDRDLTVPIEEGISSIAGLQSSQTTSAEGFAFSILQFDVGTDLKQAQADVQAKIDALTLPSGAQAPTVGTFDFTALPAVSASVSSADGSASLADV